jgi:hypothetical protein
VALEGVLDLAGPSPDESRSNASEASELLLVALCPMSEASNGEVSGTEGFEGSVGLSEREELGAE